jgi:hypothetical protein
MKMPASAKINCELPTKRDIRDRSMCDSTSETNGAAFKNSLYACRFYTYNVNLANRMR